MLSLRKRRTTDLETIVGWVPDANALYLFTGPQLAWPLTADQLAKMENDPRLSAWIGEDSASGSVMGHFDLSQENDAIRIGRFIIDPVQRGRGLAAGLLTLAVGSARYLGASRITLNVIAGNTPAIRTYQRFGFETAPMSPRTDVLAMQLTIS